MMVYLNSPDNAYGGESLLPRVHSLLPSETFRQPSKIHILYERLADRSEIKCYGSYILPPLLVFGVLAIGSGLIYVAIKRKWI